LAGRSQSGKFLNRGLLASNFWASKFLIRGFLSGSLLGSWLLESRFTNIRSCYVGFILFIFLFSLGTLGGPLVAGLFTCGFFYY
jgi:hypothetical protein